MAQFQVRRIEEVGDRDFPASPGEEDLEKSSTIAENLQVGTMANDVHHVVRDQTGRQVYSTKPPADAPVQLRPGMDF